MSRAIVVRKPGDSQSLRMENLPTPKPGPDEVLLRHTAIGVNFMDIYQRTGLYPIDGQVPIPGAEAIGVIEALGSNVDGLKVGARFGCATVPTGAYAEHRVVHHEKLVAIPDDISDEMAAATLLKGLTAHYLLYRTFNVQHFHTILVHAAAGGVGRFLVQWAKYIGARVIATVGSEAKIAAANESKPDLVINLAADNLVEKVREFTNGEMVTVAYDAVGKDTFLKSLECLMPLGLMVSYGQASGSVPPFDISLLSKNCLFLTRPNLFLYKSNRMELILSENELFEMIRRKVLKPKLSKRYEFTEQGVREAHDDIEARRTSGSCVLVVK